MNTAKIGATLTFGLSVLMFTLHPGASAQGDARNTRGTMGKVSHSDRLLARIFGTQLSKADEGPNGNPNSPTSAQTWVRNYPSSTIVGSVEYRANAIAVDGSGFVYVTGFGGTPLFDYVTIKYTSSGDTAWVRKYNSPSGSDDRASAIAVDGSGNVYVTGISYGSGTAYDYATVKYNSSGAFQWARRYNGRGNGDDVPTDIALDASGNVYVTGFSPDTTENNNKDFATIKYSSNGDSLWAVRYNNGVSGGDDAAAAISVSNSGIVYVTGSGAIPGNSKSEFVTIRYNGATGDTVWTRHYKSSTSDEALAWDLTVDSFGSALVTGSSLNAPNDNDIATVKYDSMGAQLWASRYNNGDGDEAFTIGVDGSGGVYVAGRTRDSVTFYDFVTIKYNSAGAQQWAATYKGVGSSSDAAARLVLDGSSNVYVTGNSNSHYATLKYSPFGVREWVQTYLGPGATTDEVTSLAISSLGDVYVTGASAAGNGSIFTTVKYVQATISAAPKVFLEGPYNTATDVMNTTLRASVLPARFAGLLIPSKAVDSITVEIRDSASAASSTIRRFAQAWLLADGTVRNFTDTTKAFVEFDAPASLYYMVIRHRNHLAVMSSSKVDFASSEEPASWDFSTALSKAYLNGQKQIDSSPVWYGMVAGDGNGSGGINATDRNLVWRPQNGTAGYLGGDFNLSGGVNATDRNIYWRVNNGIATQVP